MSTAPLEEITAAIHTVACPSCKAKAGQPCTYRDGSPLYGGIHSWRLDAYHGLRP